MRSPIWWFGGKGMMTKKLLPLIPEHKTYVEPFGGGASLLLAKKPSPVEVYNDVDSGLVNFFKVLSDPKLFERFYRKVAVLPYSRELYNECRESWQECEDSVERAVRWFVVARQSFSGRFGASWSFAVTKSARGMAGRASWWLSAIEQLPEIHTRLQRVQIEHNDFRKVIKAYDTPETFFYLDPPYVHLTRSSSRYQHELSDADHKDLIELLKNIKGKVLLSGYDNPLYEDLGWHKKQWQTVCHAAGKTRAAKIQGKGSAKKMQPRTECVWMNYENSVLWKNKG